jgi:hypothetical protein
MQWLLVNIIQFINVWLCVSEMINEVCFHDPWTSVHYIQIDWTFSHVYNRKISGKIYGKISNILLDIFHLMATNIAVIFIHVMRDRFTNIIFSQSSAIIFMAFKNSSHAWRAKPPSILTDDGYDGTDYTI